MTNPSDFAHFLNAFPTSLHQKAERYLFHDTNSAPNAELLAAHSTAIRRQFSGTDADCGYFVHHVAMRSVSRNRDDFDQSFQRIEGELDGYHRVRTFLPPDANPEQPWKKTSVYFYGPDVITPEELATQIQDAASGAPTHHPGVFWTAYNLSALPNLRYEDEWAIPLLSIVNGGSIPERTRYDLLAHPSIPFEIKANILTATNESINHFAVLTPDPNFSMRIFAENGAIPNTLQIGDTMDQQSNYCEGNYVEVVHLKSVDTLQSFEIEAGRGDGSLRHSEAAKNAKIKIVLDRFIYTNAQALFESIDKAILEEVFRLKMLHDWPIHPSLIAKANDLIARNIPIDGVPAL